MGSPLKRQRASLPGADDESVRRRLGLGQSAVRADVLGTIEQGSGSNESGSNNIGPAAQDRPGFGGMLGAETPDKEKDNKVKTEQMEDEEL